MVYKSSQQKKRKKILIECHHGIGDLIMTLPAIIQIREKYPQAEIHMLVRDEQQQNLLLTTGLVQKCYMLNIVDVSIYKLASLIVQFKREHYDRGYAFGQSPKGWDVLLLKLGGCRNVISIKHQHPLCGKYTAIDVSGCTHRVEQHLRCVGCSDYEKPDQALISFPNDLVQAIKNKYHIIDQGIKVGLCIGTGDFFYRKGKKTIFYNAKEWNLSNFFKLGSDLQKRGYHVFYFGGDRERKLLDEQQLQILEDGIDFVGKLCLIDTVVLLSICDIVVGADTGLMHCASAAGTTTVTVFGATDERIVGPYSKRAHYIVNKKCPCRPCYGRESQTIIRCSNRKCLQEISEQMVYNKVVNVIEERNE